MPLVWVPLPYQCILWGSGDVENVLVFRRLEERPQGPKEALSSLHLFPHMLSQRHSFWLICTKAILNWRKFVWSRQRLCTWDSASERSSREWAYSLGWGNVQAKPLLTLWCNRVLILTCIFQENALCWDNDEGNLLLCRPLIIVTLGIPSELYLPKLWPLDVSWGQHSAPLQPNKDSSCVKASPLSGRVPPPSIYALSSHTSTHPCMRPGGCLGFRCPITN